MDKGERYEKELADWARRRREIYDKVFPKDGSKGMSMVNAGLLYGISRERVRQICRMEERPPWEE